MQVETRTCCDGPGADTLQTYHAMCYDHLLPIFFEDDRAVGETISSVASSSLLDFPGGLGLSIPAVGMISKYPIVLAYDRTVSWRA